MIKLKMIDVLNSLRVLNKLGDNNSFNISIQFKFKVAMLIEKLLVYYNQYNKQMQYLINEYNIEIVNNQFINKDKNKLNEFLKAKNELEDIEIEIEQNLIIYNKNINDISANELLILKPFFDYSELETE